MMRCSFVPTVVMVLTAWWAGDLNAVAGDLTFLKLHGRWTQSPVGYFLGGDEGSVAINDKWIAAGASFADEQASNQGAVQIFNAVTGAWVRKLLPPTNAANQRFGCSVLLSGDLVIVGARGSGIAGAVHVFNAATGKFLRTLTPTGSAAGDLFGYAMAVEGDLLAVSSLNLQRVWLFRLSSGQQTMGALIPSDPQGSGEFGISLSMEGDLLLVGAPGVDTAKGAAYLFSVASPTTAVQIAKIVPTGASAGDNTARTVALRQGRAIMGCTLDEAGVGSVKVVSTRDLAFPIPVVLTPQGSTSEFGTHLAVSDGTVVGIGSSDGSARVFHQGYTAQEAIITPPDLPAQLGAVALNNGTLVLSDPFDDTQANNNGALYVVRRVTVSLPFVTVAARGDSALGVEGCTFAKFESTDLNGASVFLAGLAGPGSGGGRDKGLWRENGSNTLQMKSRTPLLPQPAPTVASMGPPLLKGYDGVSAPPINEAVIYRATLSGTGVSASNNQAILRSLIAGGTKLLVRTGFDLPTAMGTGRIPSSIGQLSVPDRDNSIIFTAKLKANPPLVDKPNDRILVWYNDGNPPVLPSLAYISEGEGTPLGTMGEPTGHFAYEKNQMLFSAALTSGPTTQNQGLFRKTSQSAILTGIATKGLDLVPDSNGNPQPGVTFSSFLAESIDHNESAVIRATIQGPGITAKNREGLWLVGNMSVTRRLAQTGSPIAGGSVAGFRAFWAAGEQGLTWIKLSGPGVTAANDHAVVVTQVGGAVDGEPLILLREGDPAPGCAPAKIGTINAVEVDPSSGQYLILATLTGTSPARNLVLFQGNSAATVSTAERSVIRRPAPILRKGDTFNSQPSPIQSISISTMSRTPGGAGSVGWASVITGGSNSSGTVLITITYANGSTRLVRTRVVF